MNRSTLLSALAVAFLSTGAMANLDRWSRSDTPPPHGEPIKVQESGTTSRVDTDSFGNALGGVRTPALDVPVARYHA